MTRTWDDALLEAARKQGDPDADTMVAEILTGAPAAGISRGGYNHLLDLANVLVANPELSLVRDSRLRRQLDQAGHVASFFDPIEAPAWVDEEKLARAAGLWRTDSLLCIAVLYAASLPACYLMKRGVPALYATEKLSEQKYVFQRIFETGVMLEGVMSPGGIKVAHDVEPNSDEIIAGVLNAMDPLGLWVWQNHRLRRTGEGDSPLTAATVQQAFEDSRKQAKRYIWGGGIISARKVRFLHSAMRHMLQHPESTRGITKEILDERARTFVEQAQYRKAPWDTAALGVPINQEDLAFVLLTFGYLIPKGMDVWGRAVPRQQKEDILHLWRVVGYVMGIREDLMTDDLDEAEALYETILRRNAGSSEPAQILTSAIMDFLRKYLPERFGLAQTVPASLIIDQLGLDRAKLLLTDRDLRAARRPLTRMGHGFARTSIRLYYWLRRNLLRYVPVVGTGVSVLTQHAADALIDSWRDSFRRNPFYIPTQATTWVMQRGVTDAYEADLLKWRQRLFDTMAAGLGGLIFAGFGLALTLVFFFLDMEYARDVFLVATVATFTLAVIALRYMVPHIALQRPVVDDGTTKTGRSPSEPAVKAAS
jgi:hypothetical protein